MSSTKQVSRDLHERFMRPVVISTNRNKGFLGGEYSAFTGNPDGGENLIGVGHSRQEAISDLVAKYEATKYARTIAKTRPYVA